MQAVFGAKTATKTTYVCVDCAHPHFLHCHWPACGECVAALRRVWLLLGVKGCSVVLVKQVQPHVHEINFARGVLTVLQPFMHSVTIGGWIYDERAAFDSLPFSYRCPVCNAPKRRCATALVRERVVSFAARLQLSLFLRVHRFKQQAPKSKAAPGVAAKLGAQRLRAGPWTSAHGRPCTVLSTSCNGLSVEVQSPDALHGVQGRSHAAKAPFVCGCWRFGVPGGR